MVETSSANDVGTLCVRRVVVDDRVESEGPVVAVAADLR